MNYIKRNISIQTNENESFDKTKYNKEYAKQYQKQKILCKTCNRQYNPITFKVHLKSQKHILKVALETLKLKSQYNIETPVE